MSDATVPWELRFWEISERQGMVIEMGRDMGSEAGMSLGGEEWRQARRAESDLQFMFKQVPNPRVLVLQRGGDKWCYSWCCIWGEGMGQRHGRSNACSIDREIERRGGMRRWMGLGRILGQEAGAVSIAWCLTSIFSDEGGTAATRVSMQKRGYFQ